VVKKLHVSITFLEPSNSGFLSEKGFLLTSKIHKAPTLNLLQLSNSDIGRVLMQGMLGNPQGIPRFNRSCRNIRG